MGLESDWDWDGIGKLQKIILSCQMVFLLFARWWGSPNKICTAKMVYALQEIINWKRCPAWCFALTSDHGKTVLLSMILHKTPGSRLYTSSWWSLNEKHKTNEMLRTGRMMILMMVLVSVLMMTTMVAMTMVMTWLTLSKSTRRRIGRRSLRALIVAASVGSKSSLSPFITRSVSRSLSPFIRALLPGLPSLTSPPTPF